uniref:Uncharacterized protein n=1 Tax=Lactuca sativa TaxID=4236 RepID=A0A9R1XLN7_LACSA|nr:hypothetical protein LSAT_V11C300152630 [Lactuca sativa]
MFSLIKCSQLRCGILKLSLFHICSPLLDSDPSVLVLRYLLLPRASLYTDYLSTSCSNGVIPLASPDVQVRFSLHHSRKCVSIALLQVLSISYIPTSCSSAICSIVDSWECQLFTEFDFGLDRSASIGPSATPSSASKRMELRSSLSSL